MGPRVYGASTVVPPREFRITQELIEYDFNLNQAFDLVTSYNHRLFGRKLVVLSQLKNVLET